MAKPCPHCGDLMSNPRRVQCSKPECQRLGRNARMNAYNRAYKAKHGEWPATRYGPSMREVTCLACGRVYMSSNRRAKYCNKTCWADATRPARDAALLAARVAAHSQVVHVGPSYPYCSVRWPHSWRWPSVIRKPRLFCSGPCSWCGDQFTIIDQTQARYCSPRCAKQADRARSGRFRIPPRHRVAIYERDGWTCQLCFEPVDPALGPSNRWAATLDHIECQSWALIPDHSPKNLRLAHRSCNSARSDESHRPAVGSAA